MLRRIMPSTDLAVSVARAKERLRIVDNDDDADLEAAIRAAAAAVERNALISVLPATYQYVRTGWGHQPICLPMSPVRDVTAVRYLDEDHVEQDLPGTDWYWTPTREGADLWFGEGVALPGLSPRAQSVRVDFTAGFNLPAEQGSGVDHELDQPPDLVLAILFLVGHWDAHRESIITGTIVQEMRQTFEFLIQGFRVFR